MGLEFGISLGDGVSTVAISAAQQVAVLTKKMSSLQDAMIGANAAGDSKQFDKLISQYEKLNQTMSTLPPQANQTTHALSESSAGMEMAAGACEAITMAAIAAVAALAALAAAGVAAGVALSISEGENRQALVATTQAMAANGAEADKLLDTIGRMTSALPMTKDRVEDLSRSFMAAGMRSAPALEQALRATAAASALLGNEAGDKIANLLKKVEMLADAGKSVKNLSKALLGTGLTATDVAKQFGLAGDQLEGALKSGKIKSEQLGDAISHAMIEKGANAVDKANMRIGVMFQKLKDGAADIFEGVVETEGYKEFLGAIKQISLLFESMAGGAKKGVTSAFGFIFSVMAKTIIFGIIYGLKFATVLLQMYTATFPFTHAMLVLTRTSLKWFALTMAFITVNKNFVTGLKVLGVVLLAITAAALLIVSPFILAAAAVVALGAGIVWLAGWITNNIIPVLKGLAMILLLPIAPILAVIAIFKWAGEWLAGWAKKGFKIASDFVAGIMLGLAGGMKPVGDLSAKLGAAMEKGAKASIDAHSPSIVGKDIARMFGAGMEVGLVESASGVEAKAQGLGSSMAGGAAGAGGKGGSGSGVTVYVEAGAIVINGGGQSAMELTEEALADLFDRVLMQQGGLST